MHVCCQFDGGKKVARVFVVSGRNASEPFEFVEDAFDQVALAIAHALKGKLALRFRFAGMLAQTRLSFARSRKVLVS